VSGNLKHMPTSHYDFDILVIGAGHAGAEAAMMAL
jgi:tRNA U34 5-carboxymethylaminomethyl modifying enzyme MnmG/GidA